MHGTGEGGCAGRLGAVQERHRRAERQGLVRRPVAVGVEIGGDRREFRVHSERREGLVAGHHVDRAEVVDVVRRPVLEPRDAGSVELDVDDRALRGSEQDLLDERLALVATAVAADELHPSVGDRDVEDPGVGRVDEVEPDDLAQRDARLEALLAVHEQHVAEPAHGGERRTGAAERRDHAVLDQEVVERDRELPIDARPVARVRGLDDDRPVHPHLLAVVLAEMGVVPVEAGIRELDAVREDAADLDRCLRVDRDAVEAVVEPEAVPVDRRLDVTVVRDVDDDLGPLVDVKRRAGDGAVVGDHPDGGPADVLDDGRDLEGQSIAVAEPMQGGSLDEREARRVAGKQVGCGHGRLLRRVRRVPASRSQRRAGRRGRARPAFG